MSKQAKPATEQPIRSYQCTFVDLRLPNSQKRKTMLVKAVNKKQAEVVFNATKGADFRALAIDEVNTTLQPGALDALVTVFSARTAA